MPNFIIFTEEISGFEQILMYKFRFSFALIFIFCLKSFGQQVYVEGFSHSEGLPHSQVTAIEKDHRGILWIGTYGGGLSSYNGYEFKSLKKGQLGNKAILSLEFDSSRKTLWIGTIEGLYYYDGKTVESYDQITSEKSIINDILIDGDQLHLATNNGVYQYNIKTETLLHHYTKENGLLEKNVRSLCLGGNDALYLGYQEGGISKIAVTITHYLDQELGNIGNIRDIIALNDQEIWLAGQKGITRVMDNNESFHFTEPFLQTSITGLYKDQNETIWASSMEQGLFFFQGNQWKQLSTKNGLPTNRFLCLKGFSDQSIWLGSDGLGIIKYLGNDFISYSKTDGLSGDIVTAIQEDLTGNMYIGTAGNGVDLIKTSGEIVPLSHLYPNFNSQYIGAIKEDQKGRIWVCSWEQGAYRIENNKGKVIDRGLDKKVLISLHIARDGKIWAGGIDGLYLFNEENQSFEKHPISEEIFKSKNMISAIAEGSGGSIYLGTLKGLYQINQTKTTRYTTNDGLPANHILCLKADKDDLLWIGTNQGLGKLQQKKLQTYTTEQGLFSDIIYTIDQNKEGDLFIGSEKGLDKISLNGNGEIIYAYHYSKNDGFTGIECNAKANFIDKYGYIWIGTVKGAFRFNPNYNQNRPANFNIEMDLVELHYKEANWEERETLVSHWKNIPNNFQLNHNDNHITFRFTGVEINHPSDVNYQYQLIGFEDDWSPLNKIRSATYSNLPPGNYTFKIRGKIKGANSWSMGPETSFVLLPPFWSRWWFVLISIGCAVIGVIAFVKNRTARLKETKQLLEKKVRVRTRELVKQKQILENLSLAAKETGDGVVIADNKGNIEWLNEGMTRLTGYNLHELKKRVGSTLSEVSTYKEIDRKMHSVLVNKKMERYESSHRHKNGKELWTTASLSPVLDETNKVRKIVAIYSDITKIKETEQKLIQKNQSITENITYAKKIQKAILPNQETLINKYNAFIFFKPKDIVSGDFYWFKDIGTHLVFAAADCTGHGVHAALLSMIGNEFLHQVYGNDLPIAPNDALAQLDQKLKTSLSQNGKEFETKDGMDIALCVLNKKTHQLSYSGAFRPLILIRNKEITEIKADKFSLGGYTRKIKQFQNHELNLLKGDNLYIFSDGLTDQFGGERDKKYSLKRLRNMFIENHHLPMHDQKEILKKEFNGWKGEKEQIDDVLVMGIKI